MTTRSSAVFSLAQAFTPEEPKDDQFTRLLQEALIYALAQSLGKKH